MQSNQIIIFDENWSFKSNYSITINPFFARIISNYFYLTNNNGFYKVMFNGTIKEQYFRNGSSFRGIYYHENNNTIIVANKGVNCIDIFDQNLNLLETISTLAHSPHYVSIFNDDFYVGTLTGYLLVIKNKTVDRTQLICTLNNFLFSFLIDKYGFIALACEQDNSTLLYHINGTYLTKVYVDSPRYAYFDKDSRLVITGKNLINAYGLD